MGYEDERRRLVERLQRQGHLRTERVAAAFMAVPREAFLPSYLSHRAYDDEPLPIGHFQTISAPHMVAIMTEALKAEPGQKVLEVGTGSGYQAAVLARLVSPGGRIVSIEFIEQLGQRAKQALMEAGATSVDVIVGDGSQGHPPAAPYDRILVTAAAPKVPAPLVDQLAPDGILLVPVGERTCDLIRVRKTGTGTTSESLGACAFVPLKGAYGQ